MAKGRQDNSAGARGDTVVPRYKAIAGTRSEKEVIAGHGIYTRKYQDTENKTLVTRYGFFDTRGGFHDYQSLHRAGEARRQWGAGAAPPGVTFGDEPTSKSGMVKTQSGRVIAPVTGQPSATSKIEPALDEKGKLRQQIERLEITAKDRATPPRQREAARKRLYELRMQVAVANATKKAKASAKARRIAEAKFPDKLRTQYAKTGSKWDPSAGKHLRPSQYVNRHGVVRSATVSKAHEMKFRKMHPPPKAKTDSERRAAERKFMGEPAWGAKKADRERGRLQRMSPAEVAKRQAEREKRRIAATKRKQAARTKRIRDAKSKLMVPFRRQVTALLTDRPRLVRDFIRSGEFSFGERKVLRNLPHAMRYPPMRHASGKPFMPQPTRAGPIHVSQWQGSPGVAPISSASRGTMYTTPDVLFPHKRITDPRGIVFNVDVSEVISLYNTGFPYAVRSAVKESRPIIAKKLMDIIEPYVPKDTGAMYTSAEDLTDAGAEGDLPVMDGSGAVGDSLVGATIAYRTPYAEIVYFDLGGHKRHGAEYNAHHGTSEKGEKETARWIEVAFEREGHQIDAIMGDIAANFRRAMNKEAQKLGYKRFKVFTPKAGANMGISRAFLSMT